MTELLRSTRADCSRSLLSSTHEIEMTAAANASVLIVGSSPTGMTPALTFQRHGIATCVIDKLDQPVDLSKELVVWPASLEVQADIGEQCV